MIAHELVVLWKRRDGLRCVALKPTARRTDDQRQWELRVTRPGRIIKREFFPGFRAALRAAQLWRADFVPE